MDIQREANAKLEQAQREARAKLEEAQGERDEALQGMARAQVLLARALNGLLISISLDLPVFPGPAKKREDGDATSAGATTGIKMTYHPAPITYT